MFDEKSHSLKMDKAIDVFSKELSSLRTGRANAAMLDLIKVDVYGQQMPINQIGSITAPEPRMINIQVWDLNNVNLTVKIRTKMGVDLIHCDTFRLNKKTYSFKKGEYIFGCDMKMPLQHQKLLM